MLTQPVSAQVEGDYVGMGLSDIRRIKRREESVEQYLSEKQKKMEEMGNSE